MKRLGEMLGRPGAGTVILALSLCCAWGAWPQARGAEPGDSPGSHQGGPAVGPSCLRILFTAETRGNLEPCRCPDRPLGGLARRAALLASPPDPAALLGTIDDSPERRAGAAADSRHPVCPTSAMLRLDLGGFLPEGQVSLADRPAVEERYVSLLLEGLLASEIDLGVLDHGMESYLRKTAPEEFLRLAPRFLRADPPDPPRTVDWMGRKVALLALEEQLPDETIREAAARAWDAAGPGGYLFVLGRADGLSGRRLARLTQADLVLLSRGSRFPQPLSEGRSLLVACGAQGKEVGDLLLRPARPGAADPERGTSAGTAQPRRGLNTGPPYQAPEGRIAILAWSLYPMDATWPEDPLLAREVQALLEEAGPGYHALIEPAE